MIEVTLPLRILSEANQRGHWSKGAKRAKEQRGITKLAVNHWRHGGRHYDWLILHGGLVLTLTRIAPRRLDGDNLQRAFKAVRDGVADALGIDDGDARLEWRYEQRSTLASPGCVEKGYGVHIRIEAKEGFAQERA